MAAQGFVVAFNDATGRTRELRADDLGDLSNLLAILRRAGMHVVAVWSRGDGLALQWTCTAPAPRPHGPHP